MSSATTSPSTSTSTPALCHPDRRASPGGHRPDRQHRQGLARLAAIPHQDSTTIPRSRPTASHSPQSSRTQPAPEEALQQSGCTASLSAAVARQVFLRPAAEAAPQRLLEPPPGEWHSSDHTTVQNDMIEHISRRLYAAKPLSWRGASDLPQLPWRSPCTGLVLVLDLWAGLGGLLVALLALGVRCIAISAECDPELRQAKKKLFANLVEIEQVEMIKGSMFERVLARRNFSAILVGWGLALPGQQLPEPPKTRSW